MQTHDQYNKLMVFLLNFTSIFVMSPYSATVASLFMMSEKCRNDLEMIASKVQPGCLGFFCLDSDLEIERGHKTFLY